VRDLVQKLIEPHHHYRVRRVLVCRKLKKGEDIELVDIVSESDLIGRENISLFFFLNRSAFAASNMEIYKETKKVNARIGYIFQDVLLLCLQAKKTLSQLYLERPIVLVRVDSPFCDTLELLVKVRMLSSSFLLNSFRTESAD